jgi:CheY-like chemotaxis protein
LEDDDVYIARDGLAGLAYLAEAERQGRPFQVVLCDHGMPALKGGELVHILSTRPHRPLLVLMATWTELAEARGMGDGVVLKPFGARELSDALASARSGHEKGKTCRISRQILVSLVEHDDPLD